MSPSERPCIVTSPSPNAPSTVSRLTRGWDLIRSTTDVVLGFIYPPWCQLCQSQRAGSAEGYVCSVCTRTVHRVKPPFCYRCGLPFEGAITRVFTCANCSGRELAFDHARAAVIAEGVLLEVIHRYKYQQALWFEPFLARWLLEAAAPSLDPGHWQWIVPVPLHPVRQRERGFNQAERLARRLSKHTGIPLATDFLERRDFHSTQTQLSRKQREENVARAFHPRRETALNRARCIVVDDVLTTGATTNAVAQTLRRLGAEEVIVWSVARARFEPELIGEDRSG